MLQNVKKKLIIRYCELLLIIFENFRFCVYYFKFEDSKQVVLSGIPFIIYCLR